MTAIYTNFLCHRIQPSIGGLWRQSLSLAWFGCLVALSRLTVAQIDETSLVSPPSNEQEAVDAGSVEPGRLNPVNLTQAIFLPGSQWETVTAAAFLTGYQQAVGAEVENGSSSNPSEPSIEVLQTADVDPGKALTLEAIAAFRAEAEQSPDGEGTFKPQILAHLDRAASFLQQRIEVEQKHSKLKAERENGPALIAELKAELQRPAPSSEPEFVPEASVSELDRLRLADQERLDEARKNLEAWETRAKTRAERRPQMPSLIETTRNQIEEAKKAAGTLSADSEPPQLAKARQLEQQAHVVFLSAQLELYQIEQLRYEALQELFPLQRDQLTRHRNALEKKSERWKEVLTQARLKESNQQRLDARRRLELAHPALRDMAARNSWLTQYRQEHLQLRSTWRTEQAAINDSLESLRQKFNEVQDRVERVGLTTAIGLTLRNQKSSLPIASTYRRFQREAEEEFLRLQTEQLQLDDDRKALDDIDSHIDRIVASIYASGQPTDVTDDELRKMTREHLMLQREYLEAILSDLESSLTMLVDKEYSCRQLTQLIREYDDYIDQRVLWIRSVPVLSWSAPQKAAQALGGLLDPRPWRALLNFTVNDIRSNGSLYALVLLVVAVLTYARRRMFEAIRNIDPRSITALNAGVHRISLSLAAILLVASCWPMPMAFMSWRLSESEMNLGSAFSSALIYSSIMLWVLTVALGVVQKDSVAERLWQWPVSVVKNLRKNLRVYMLAGVPLCAAFVGSHRLDDGATTETIGRLAFVLFCIVVSFVLASALNPRGAIFSNWLRSTANPLAYKTRWLWYPAAVAAPLSLAVLAIMGYLYTAEQLMLRLEMTLGLMVILVVVGTIVNRWLLVARRRLALQQARWKREAELAASPEAASSDLNIPVEPETLDLSAVNRQVMRLVQVAGAGLMLWGCWMIWDQVFPATQIFTRVEVWSTISTVAEVVETPTGPQVQESSRLRSITREHVIIAISLFTICILASRNLPGLLELSVLQRLPMDSGSRNAVKLLTGYAFIAVGIIVSTNIIGMQWRNVQWLVAALTVGLGFGLQEIFANFVSGLIILFERPVRIGDVVTIDGVSGTVTKIRSRATTITDWDRKDFIVPNKEFVTGRLLNWTLTDKMTRLLINVGVACGSDVRLALELLKQIADEHPLVLKDPAPVSGFESFGESSLNLVLRSYLPSLESRLQVLTDLNTAINDRFREAGIEIAFPQRDLHIRSISSPSSEAAGLFPHHLESSAFPGEDGTKNASGTPFVRQGKDAA